MLPVLQLLLPSCIAISVIACLILGSSDDIRRCLVEFSWLNAEIIHLDKHKHLKGLCTVMAFAHLALTDILEAGARFVHSNITFS